MSGFTTRFAPSPTGLLHRGHAFSALTAWTAAREAGGRFLLRIEDIDRERCRPEYETAIQRDLAWLGLDWEEPVRRQSRHMADYQAALERLGDMGVLYRCFRTRREVLDEIARAPHGPTEAFVGAPLPADEEARRLEAGEPYAWRLSLDAAEERLGSAFDPTMAGAGDVVLARKDLGVAYHLASVVDDALQGVTHVIRGEDLTEAAPIHRLLQALLGLPTPTYIHHRLILGLAGRRLAKRDRSETLADLRGRGISAADVREGLGF